MTITWSLSAVGKVSHCHLAPGRYVTPKTARTVHRPPMSAIGGKAPLPRDSRLSTNGILTIRGLGVTFVRSRRGVTTIHGLSFDLRHNRALTVINRSNSNGSIATLTLVHLLRRTNNLMRYSGVLLRQHDHRIVRLDRRDTTRVHRIHNTSVTVVFRRPVASLGPMFAINRRVTRSVHLRRGTDHRRTVIRTGQVLSRMHVPRTRAVLSHCPRRLSNKVHRQIVVTVTLSYHPTILVTSRPAATLSIAVRTRVLRLVGMLRGRVSVNIVFVARSVNIITRVTSQMLIVCRNRTIRANAIRRVFRTPRRPCAHTLLTTIPRLNTVGKLSCPQHFPLVSLRRPTGRTPPVRRGAIISNRPILQIHGLIAHFPLHDNLLGHMAQRIRTIRGIDFSL